MELFQVFSIAVVCHAKKGDGRIVVGEAVDLWNVEVRVQLEVQKNSFIFVESAETSLKAVEGVSCM